MPTDATRTPSSNGASPYGVVRSSVFAGSLCVFGASMSGCLVNEGVDPPHGTLNFPVAIELVDATGLGAPTHLVVANTNFDLGFNSATAQSYDLSVIEATLGVECAGLSGNECAIVPPESGEPAGTRGNVRVSVAQGLLASEVVIGSFAEGITPSSSGRTLYVPVRSDSDLTRLSVDGLGRLSCGGTPGERHECDDAHRTTVRDAVGDRDLSSPIEPLDVLALPFSALGAGVGTGDFLGIAHRDGALSFWSVPDENAAPELVDVLDFDNASFSNVAFDHARRRFLLPSVRGGYIARASVSLGTGTAAPETATLGRMASLQVAGLDVGNSTPGTRQVMLDPRVGTLHEGRFYLVGSTPAALIVGREAPNTSTLAIDAVLPLGAQPSRLQLLEIEGRLLAFVTCYLSRDIYVYDVDSARLVSIVRGFNGPFETAVDLARERMYVTDFRVSVVHVVDLGPLVECLALTTPPAAEGSCAPIALGMVGIPSTVAELR